MKNRIFVYITIAVFFISCKKENNLLNAQNIKTAQELIKTIELPVDSTIFKYSNKDKNGYFIYDKTFKKNQYSNTLSRIVGKVSLNNKINLLFVERKPNDDEYIEPIVTLYSLENNKKVDSLNIYETLKSEGSLQKRFLISRDKIIHLYENSSGYDFSDNGKEILVTEKKNETYSISENGRFILQQNSQINIKNNPKPDKSWLGEYSIESDAISNFDNKKIRLKYYININSLTEAILSIGADQPQDYTCEGDYTLQIEKSEIYASGKCDSDDINDFYIKKEDNNFFIKSKRFINQDWQELTKEK